MRPFEIILFLLLLLQESERYAYEWQRCLENALEVGAFVCLFLFLLQPPLRQKIKHVVLLINVISNKEL